jgi:carboxyl-terminal processing protease
MKYSQRIGLVILALVLIGGSFFAGTFVGSENSNAAAIDQITSLSNKETGKPSNVDFSIFWNAWNIINQEYVPTHTATTTDDQDRVYGAIQGMVASLGDPYTTFFTPAEAKIFNSEITGDFEGVGMEVVINNGYLTVVSALKGTPAAAAGILPGDKILKINGKDTSALTADEAVDLIRGQTGTKVTFTLLRDSNQNLNASSTVNEMLASSTLPLNTDARYEYASSSTATSSTPFDVTLTRSQINIPTLETKTLPGGVFVISLYTFTADAPDLFRTALRQYVTSGDDKLILDLRGNPGGYLDSAVDIASWFLPAGDVVVRERYGNGKPDDISKSKGYNIFSPDMKFAILIDGGSASASEILAGALSEYGRAKLVGERSFGKGSVQQLVNLTPDTALKVTVARWFTPQNKSISDGGLTPDVIVPITQDDIAAGRDPQIDAAVKLLNQ